MELKKKFIMAQEDYLKFNFFHMKNRLILISAMLILPAAVVISAFISIGSEVFSSTVIILCAGCVVLVPLNILSLWIIAKKQYKSAKAMTSETELVVNDAGISETSKYGSTTMPWDDILKATESKSGIYIYFSKLQAYLIPKRILTEEEINTLTALIKEKLPAKKCRLL